MVLSLRENMIVGTHFMVIEGFTMGVGSLFMEENLAGGVWEKAGVGFRRVCVGRAVLGNRIW